MLHRVSAGLARPLRRWIPEPFVFALLLTALVALAAWALTPAGPVVLAGHWYDGFWMLLEFGMQMVLILVTGFAIALSPPAARLIDVLARRVDSPGKVYLLVLIAGGLFNLVSWGWTVLAAVLGRELARRVPGVDYAYLVACVYLSGQPWVGGLSSTIPLLLNTEGNFLIETGVLAGTLPVAATLGSTLNLAYVAMYFVLVPLLMWWARPRAGAVRELAAFGESPDSEGDGGIGPVLAATRSSTSPAARMNHSVWLQGAVAFAGLAVLALHFSANGADLDLNRMIFLFLMLGLLIHRSPARYAEAMKRACANIAGIVFQYPFYAGIMGLMMFSGLGAQLALWLADGASLTTLPLIAQFAGAAVNFAIPSAGGEWAVIGPALTEAALQLSAGMPPEMQQAFVARIAMATAFGETSTNLLQPFFLLTVLPVMGAGVRVEARDVMGYLVLPFAAVYLATALLVTLVPG
ncbi:MAG: TIGR00366 family protein [Wenzhouxiangellaceae bacterium]|nr:TIGR00366 family protein [Wenzhouxiangellaceae bacterium]